MQLITTSLRILKEAAIVALGIPKEATGTIDPCPGSLTTISTGPKAVVPTLLRSRLIKLDGTSKQPRAYEAVMRAAGIPKPPMAQRMSPKSHELRGRTPAKGPAITSASANAMQSTK